MLLHKIGQYLATAGRESKNYIDTGNRRSMYVNRGGGVGGSGGGGGGSSSFTSGAVGGGVVIDTIVVITITIIIIIIIIITIITILITITAGKTTCATMGTCECVDECATYTHPR